MVNVEVPGALLLDIGVLEMGLLDTELLIIAMEERLLEVAGVLDLTELELPGIDEGAVDEEIAMEVAVDDVLPLHKLPFILGAPAEPFA